MQHLLDEELLLGAISAAEDQQWTESIRQEFLRGFDALRRLRPGVTVFGSARTPVGSPLYQQGVEVGSALARAGFPVITGGGPGLMAAANEGARRAGGDSVGIAIELPNEQHQNQHLTLQVTFEHFFVRKLMLVRYACGFVALPGGFGTLDELFEVLTLVQTGKVHEFPVVLIGTEYWGGLVAWVREQLLAGGTISPEDLRLLLVTDDLEEAVALIAECASRQTARLADLPAIAARLSAPES